MGQIRQYEQNVEATERYLPDPHVPSGANVASSIEGFGAAVSDVGEAMFSVSQMQQKQQTEQEVTDVRVKLAQARAAQTKVLQDSSATMTPGDMGFADRFTAAATNDVQKISEGIQTKAGMREFQLGSADLLSELSIKAGGYQAAAAGVKAVNDYKALRDANTNTLTLDPSQFGRIDADMRATLNDPNGPYARISPEQRAELERTTREDLGYAAVLGKIRMNPAGAAREIESGKWNAVLGNDKVNALLNLAQSTEQHNAAMVEHAINMQNAAETRAERYALHDYTQAIAQGDTKTAGQIFGGLPPERQVQALDFTKRWDEKGLGDELAHPSNPDAEIRVRNGIYADPTDPKRIKDPSQIWTEFNAGNLSRAKTIMFLNEWSKTDKQGSAYASAKRNFFSGVQRDVFKSNAFGLKNPAGDQAYNDWYQTALQRWDVMEHSGKKYHEITKSLAEDAKQNAPNHNDVIRSILKSIDPNAELPKQKSATVAPGDIYKGYRFKGGDPRDKANWDKVQ